MRRGVEREVGVIGEAIGAGDGLTNRAQLEVLQEAVQDYEYNITRFAIICGAPTPDADKTTIVFALPSPPCALFNAPSFFALRYIHLTKLPSPPIRGRPREYTLLLALHARRNALPASLPAPTLAE